jgi:hypothetical protein
MHTVSALFVSPLFFFLPWERKEKPVAEERGQGKKAFS